MKLVLVALIIYLCGSFSCSVFTLFQNKSYPAEVFSGLTYESVLESRKWHQGGLTCTYAIVQLEDSATDLPPKQWHRGTTWHATPLKFEQTELGIGECRNLVCNCRGDWSPENYRRVEDALNQPGSYTDWRMPLAKSVRQGTVSIYSKPAGIAAYVRYGD